VGFVCSQVVRVILFIVVRGLQTRLGCGILKPELHQNNNQDSLCVSKKTHLVCITYRLFVSPQNADLFRNCLYHKERFLNSYVRNVDIVDCAHGVNFNRQFTTFLVKINFLNRIAASNSRNLV
jgi:hypothetical protein